MLKIYNAYSLNGDLVLKDYIIFKEGGRYDTGPNGYGEIRSGNLSCEVANYELINLSSFEAALDGVKKVDGFVKNFSLWNPVSYDKLVKKYRDIPKDFKTYEEYGLTEEGILLFTDWVNVNCKNDDSVRRLFGRIRETGLYLVKPGASFSMSTAFSNSDEENFEVLQSNGVAKQLFLTKLNRKV